MFGTSKFIDETHKAVMASVIRQHNVVHEKLLTALYEITLESINKKGALEPRQESWSYIENKDGNYVASATDPVSGIYVQLVGKTGSQQRHLTVGQKWCMQSTAAGSVVVKQW